MISHIVGLHGGNDDDGSIVVDVHGVGYRVTMHDRDQGAANGRGVGSEFNASVRAVYREGEPTLYAFFAAADRRAFDRIRDLEGCGPSTAIKVLSKMDAADFFVIVAEKDTAKLRRMTGVGPKTADKLVTCKLPGAGK